MAKNRVLSMFVGSLALCAAAPALANDWSEKIQLCAAAVQDEGLAEIENYRVKFAGGASRRVTIELIPNDEGEKLEAECRLRRGEVSSVELKA